MSASTNFIFIYSSTSSQEESQKLAEHLLSQKLIACANIIPQIQSLYRWEGKIQKDQESLLICKTQKHLYKKAEQEIKKNHSYSCPCVASLSCEDVYEGYLNWLTEQTS